MVFILLDHGLYWDTSIYNHGPFHILNSARKNNILHNEFVFAPKAKHFFFTYQNVRFLKYRKLATCFIVW